MYKQRVRKWFSRWSMGKIQASDSLLRYLQADDLDDLLEHARDLRTLNPIDAQVVRDVIRAWRDEQAVANLLFHPAFLPPERKFAALLRGLSDDQHPYLRLAAVLGLQSEDASTAETADVKVIRARLIEIIEADSL